MLITASYDTLHGYIKKSAEKRLYTSILFRQEGESAYKEYDPLRLEAVIAESFSLISHRIRLNNMDQYIFLKKVYDGNMTLYTSRLEYGSESLNDNQDLFFVEIEDGLIIQLHEKYLIRTLKAIFNDSDCTLSRIDVEKFNYYYYKESKLIDLFVAYDACQKPELALSARPMNPRLIRP